MSAESMNIIHLILPESDPPLPPLPPILDPELDTQVFTHSSFHARPRKATSLDLDDGERLLDNEKLEHVGDSLLGRFHPGSATECVLCLSFCGLRLVIHSHPPPLPLADPSELTLGQGMVVTGLLHQLYPNLKAGPATVRSTSLPNIGSG